MELPYRIKLWQRLWHRIVTVIDNSKIDGIDEREREGGMSDGVLSASF